MKQTYYKTIPQDKEQKYINSFKKLGINYAKLPSEDGCITLIFACSALQKIRLTLVL